MFDLGVAGGAADDEAGFDNAFLWAVGGEGPFDKADEDVGCLLTHLAAALLNCGEHRVTDRGAETISESADAYIIRNGITQPFYNRQDADGCLVVDSKKCVGSVLSLHHCRSDALGVGPVVADSNQ